MVIGCHHTHHHHHLMMASGPHTAAHMQLRRSGPQPAALLGEPQKSQATVCALLKGYVPCARRSPTGAG